MTSLKLEYFARVAGIWPLLEFRERFSTRKALVEEGRKMTCLACIPSAGRGGGAGTGRRQSGGGPAQGRNVGLSHR